ncbi:hypothetical protein HPB49_004547 [Dermacentor silvarum]|uniref:Uncharacterized protein n=1 Tax=Dermacentor silvarum TaxID=543639 RepID=A0ACB8DAX7_DERSI|nr:hypothetical protein HPB49_004547 [Dermacentor silvarum]
MPTSHFGSLYVEMLKAAWIEQAAERIANCFHKAEFMSPRTTDEVVEWPCDPTKVEPWQRVVDPQQAGPDVAWNDFVREYNDAEIAKPCSDKAVAREGATQRRRL